MNKINDQKLKPCHDKYGRYLSVNMPKNIIIALTKQKVSVTILILLIFCFIKKQTYTNKKKQRIVKSKMFDPTISPTPVDPFLLIII